MSGYIISHWTTSSVSDPDPDWSAGCSLLRVEGFACSLDPLHVGAEGEVNCNFFYPKNRYRYQFFSALNFFQFLAVLRVHDILGWIRIRILGSMPLTNGSGSWIRVLDPDPALFVIDLQDVSKKLIFEHNFFCLLLYEATFTSFFKDKKSKRVKKY
jgi:hypothetical protein